MSELDDAMEGHMAYVVFKERRPYSYRDFLHFEVEGQEYGMVHGTFRNKVSRLIKAGVVELSYNSCLAFYTLKGMKFGKPMTLIHTGDVVSDSRSHPIITLLESRDVDNDGLLEQSHNEDWMDTALRAGKIVYSQGCWIFGLIHLSVLLSKLGKSTDATRITRLAEKAIEAVNQKLWSKENGTYMDIQRVGSSGDDDEIYRLLTQDVTYFLIAITANTVNDSFKDIVQQQQEKKLQEQEQEQQQEKHEPTIKIPDLLHQRAISTLDAIKKRVWKDKWPLVTEGELPKTGPWPLKPYQYHNHTFWPWTTGIEMLARSRFNQVEECDILLSKLTSKDKKSVGIHTFYEWINPITDEGGGAYPFRTGISTLRLSIVDLAQKIRARHYIQ